MTLFRKKGIMNFLTALMSVVFLNLSFFHAELHAFDLKNENKALYEYLVDNFSSICEDEKDSASGESSEGESITKEINILKSSFDNINHGVLLVLAKNGYFIDAHLSDGIVFTKLQPPEILS